MTSAMRARSKPNRRPMIRVTISKVRHRTWQGLVFAVAAMVLSSCGWRGISNVELPGGPGGGGGGYTVYVQMPDTLAINGNSKVMVADVFVGSIRNIELKNWVATLTLGLDKNVKLPKNGDTIPLKNSSAYPSTEQTLASLAMVVRGGGLPNLEVLQNEVNKILTGRGPQIRTFLGKLDTFTRQ